MPRFVNELLLSKIDHSYDARKKIMIALIELHKPASSYAIKDYLDKQTAKENRMVVKDSKSKYENGELTS